MPIEILELFPIDKDEIVSDSSRTLYQQKISSLLFATIATRIDIAFDVLQLSRFNQRLGHKYHKVADWVFHYLFSIQDYCIRYRGDVQDFSSFVCTSNVFFDNNTLDRKSS